VGDVPTTVSIVAPSTPIHCFIVDSFGVWFSRTRRLVAPRIVGATGVVTITTAVAPSGITVVVIVPIVSIASIVAIVVLI
jgi:hypothetical protein